MGPVGAIVQGLDSGETTSLRAPLTFSILAVKQPAACMTWEPVGMVRQWCMN